ncbi:MAG: hypothetical protein Q4C98_02660 [Capnocytophaga sp.]|nr:hypothetical protein [Capnocytophaga sp.]
MKIRLITSLIMAFILVMVSCEREKQIDLLDATIALENQTDGTIIQEPNGKVELDAVAQSPAGIKKIEVIVGGNVAANVEFNEKVYTYYYEYMYTVPTSATLGDEISIVFRMEDNEGRIVSTSMVIVRVAQPYEIVDFIKGTNTFRKISGRINRDVTLTKDTKWLIDGVVSVDEDATLTIEEGTTVYFRTFSNTNYSQLVILRGGKIIALGTRTEPIVFTSDKVLTNNAARADWGGISINGNAPTNAGNSVISGGFRYGGTNASDNSGELRFVRIEYTGKGALHSLHLNGVGSGTTIEYLQSFESYNDALRVRGGRVSLRYIAGIQHGGYGIWADEGWQGNGQFWIFKTNIKATLTPVNYWNQARSIEFRNDDSFFEKQPRTNFKLSNITLIGTGATITDGTRRGIRIRRGAEGLFYNAIITEFPSDAVRVEDLPLETLGVNTIINHIHSYNNSVNWEQEAKTFFFDSGNYNLNETPVIGITLNDFVGTVSSPFNPASMGSWFEDAPYIGAVNPSNDWTKGGSWFKNIDGTIRQ